ncbi:MAG: hypothetical protein JSV03_14575 [Planctomycetota bacterium]|nr:MAG: hypothetical protein JSV03_14575 [Planctomycetota bacterium]
MKDADYNNSFVGEVSDGDDGIGLFPTVEYGVSACAVPVPISTTDDGDYFVSSSGLTPVQELAQALGLTDID